MATRKEILALAEVKAGDRHYSDLVRFMAVNAKAIEAVCPEGVSAKRLIRIALESIQKNEALGECTMQSLFGAIMECAAVGLEPGRGGLAYLIPFKNRKKGVTEVNVIFGYPGLVDLAIRTGKVQQITPYPVYEEDVFEIEMSYEFPIRQHKPQPPVFNKDGSRNILGYYTIANLPGGLRNVRWKWKAEIDQHREKHCRYQAYWPDGNKKNDSPWWTAEDKMGMKTLVREHCLYLPRNPFINRALEMEAASETEKGQGNSDWIIEGEVVPEDQPELPPIPDQYLDLWTAITDAFKGENGRSEAAKLFPHIEKIENETDRDAMKANFNQLFKQEAK